MNNQLCFSLIMTVAGLGIPVMAALNGGLGDKLQSPALAAIILFFVGLLCSVIYLWFTEGMPSRAGFMGAPWYFYLGGLFVAFYVLSITWVAPRFGVSNAIAFVLLGQLVAMSLVDHFAWFGVLQHAVTKQRLLGLLFMTIGVFLVLNKAPNAGT